MKNVARSSSAPANLGYSWLWQLQRRCYSDTRNEFWLAKGARVKVIVEADGGSRGNPGPAGYGALVRDAATGEVLAERAEALGITTNNVAEYSGLIAGLQAASEVGATEVDVRMDSRLVVEQMSGRWKVKHPNMRPLAVKAQNLAREFSLVTYEWIPRAQNLEADSLANQAMDSAR